MFCAFLLSNFITLFLNLVILTTKRILLLLFQNKMFECMHHIPKVHRNCDCKTIWSTFLVLLFERACCLYMLPDFMIRKWGGGARSPKFLKIMFLLHKKLFAIINETPKQTLCSLLASDMLDIVSDSMLKTSCTVSGTSVTKTRKWWQAP